MIEEIKKLAQKHHQEVVAMRRYIHANPELSFQETNTGKFIAEKLSEMGVEHRHGIADNGVVALIKGKNPEKRVIALRGDMDALPIQEKNDVPYKSTNDGVMHACGHDVHTASLLGTVQVLQALRDKFEGTVKCIFQPGEEMFPGGASIMIEQGVLENPKPVSIFGQHVHPPLRAGKIGLRSGLYMASADEIYVTVKGHGGHGAMPHDCIDPVMISAQILVTLQQIVSRYSDPNIPSVLTFGKINSLGGATNIIPNEVYMEGTFRTMDEKWREEAHHRMKKVAESLAQSMGGACDFHIDKGYPTLINNEELTARTKAWAIEFLGEENVVELNRRMTAEDFAYFSQAMPGCFYRLGTGNPDRGITSSIHTDTFDIDEAALETGVGLMSWLAIKELGR